MSLIIRRVENISRKKRKCKSTILTKKDVFEDDASKFTVVEDFYSENFPPLRPVYRKDIFGTPIVFRATNGIDYYGDVECNVLIHCITFMREYKNKSYEELRWEDYSCGRKEIVHYEENSYLKSLSIKQVIKKINYEFFDPAPKNIPTGLTKQNSLLSMYKNSSVPEIDSKKIQTLSKTARSLHSSVKSSKSFDSEKSCSNKHFLPVRDSLAPNSEEIMECPRYTIIEDKLSVKESRPRSILTYVDKLSQSANKNRPSNKSSSDVCLNIRHKCNSTRQENIEIMRNNLQRYFEQAEPSANMPYDLITQNPKFYLPCAEIGFVYQNARPSKTDETGLDVMQIINSVFENSEGIYGKQNPDALEECIEWKYTCGNKFRKEYFWNNFYPYTRIKSGRVSRAKYILSGTKITV